MADSAKSGPANAERFLIVRMGSMGDIVHTLPAVAALRDSFPAARIDWLIDSRWRALLEGNPDIGGTVSFDRKSLVELMACIRALRRADYTCTIDFQSLYKSALMAFFSGAPKRVGFDRHYAREAGAALFYTQKVSPRGTHKVEHNLSLVEGVGAKAGTVRFPLARPEEAEAWATRELESRGLRGSFVLCPGGGWRSKCWPAERFGELHQELARKHGWRGIVSFGPGEEALAEEVSRAAGKSDPAVFPMTLPQLIAVLRRAKFVVACDTGPLHLAVALGTPVVGLYGPTDPARNGPYSKIDVVVRNAKPDQTTYHRGGEYSAGMLSISVPQVLAAIERRLWGK
jgi:lipopolysaccharide heptosyltransferase I